LHARYAFSALFLVVLAAGGCAGRIHPAPAPQRPPQPATGAALRFTATAYCTGTKTAAGTSVSEGVVAADPTLLPIGTVIRISGAAQYDREYRVLDTGPKIQGRRVDVYMADCSEARLFGRRVVRVSIVREAVGR
jgi:3D (Asp-Asp-Asp) domain-containing protein